MILRHARGTWPDAPVEHYKDEPGTWVGVSRRTLLRSPGASFESRVFEIAPGGYTSFEAHTHEHFVVVLAGGGEVQLGSEVQSLAERDVVHVGPQVPHQFRAGEVGMSILCVVDQERDRPVLLGNADAPPASER